MKKMITKRFDWVTLDKEMDRNLFHVKVYELVIRVYDDLSEEIEAIFSTYQRGPEGFEETVRYDLKPNGRTWKKVVAAYQGEAK